MGLLGLVGFGWGLSGVLALLMFAIYRLAPMAFELTGLSLDSYHWFLLAVSIGYLAYAEGYKGFHKSFAPRVVARANYLLQNPRLTTTILAPLFCMGFIYATRKRMILSMMLTMMIVFFVVVVRLFAQPWRGIVDAGVVVGLALGVCSIVYYLIQFILHPESLTYSPEVPARPSINPSL